ncbi:MAG: transglutaminaseTgpA domain-containing protein [Burkholderiaceae bacterium]
MDPVSSDSVRRFPSLVRWLTPIARLFGPQTSSAARERRDTLVLLIAVALVVVPHFDHLAWWVTSVLVLLLVWRIGLTVTQKPLPGRLVMLPLLLAAAVAVYLQHRTFAGQEAGVTFLLLLMALKLLEMRARRDIFVVIFLSFFILLTQFLYGQEIPVAAMTLMAVLALFFVLVSVNLDETDLSAGRKLKLVGGVLLKAAPLAAVLFLLFPRISGPLWGMPGDGGQGSTGLSNSMAPGSISRLLESGEIAFRARFEGAAPSHEKLYWRGPVFGFFNGRSWAPLPQGNVGTGPLSIEIDPRSVVTYSVTLEPHKRDWLFALEAPAELPRLSSMETRLTSEMQLLANGLIADRIRYDMRSATDYAIGRKSTSADLRAWLDLPRGFNPRTVKFAEELNGRLDAQGQAGDADRVRAVLDHLRDSNFGYTLSPPLLGRHSVDEFLFETRLGYCEHFSSAFVVLMRALGVPARVVTGYQGGELNPVDGYMTVRQSDAHAWSEVWLQGRGWVRVDPTAVVAPARIESGVGELARRSGIELSRVVGSGGANWLRTLRFNWEAVQNSWNQWVLAYSLERQNALVEHLGFAPRWESVALLLGIAVAVVLTGLGVLSLRARTQRDPLGEAFQQLRDKLERVGVAASQSCGPRELYTRSKRALVPEDVKLAKRLLARYERMRYARSAESVTRADVRAYRRMIRSFRPRPNPL